MLYASIIFFLYRAYPGISTYLNGFNTLWGQLLSVTTFTLTFFVNQSFSLWRKCSQLSRRLQGRLHDIGLNLATHATRQTPTDPNEPSTYTADSRQILELMSRYIRLFNLLTYASFTRSHRPILTPLGMRRLEERGLMTSGERKALVDAAIPATQRHSAILMWMVRLFVEGREGGHIQGGSGFEQQTMEKFHVIRAQYGAIGDELQGRMPLAYAHIVQVLVDLILWMYPIMAFSTGMSPLLAITGTGLLTISYQGLFDLAKQFLDPYDNEAYGKGEDKLSVDTLIAETNAGSVRWLLGFEEMPFSSQRLKDGELYEYLLPVRGYSVEDLEIMEKERIQKEADMEEERQREEEERIQREEDEKLEKILENEEDEISNESLYSDVNSTVSVVENETVADTAIEDDQTISTAVPEDVEDVTEKNERPVHKVTTLAGGVPVSFTTDKYLASLSTSSDAEKRQQAIEIDESFLPADLEEEKENEVETILNDEECQDTTAESEEAAESELLEEVDTSVGLQDNEESDLVKEEPNYVQMSVDGTSQLSGLMSDDGSEFNLQEREDIEVADFNTTQQLRAAKSETFEESLKGDETAEITSMAEISGVQGASLDKNSDSMIDLVESSDQQDQSYVDANGTVSDGEEHRLSQMPEDEDLEEVVEPVETPPMTLEEYNEQVEKIISKAEEDFLETEAILNAKPGADPLGWDYDDEQLAPMTNGTEVNDEGEILPNATESDEVDVECLEALEMDVEDSIDDDEDDASKDGVPEIDRSMSSSASKLDVSNEAAVEATSEDMMPHTSTDPNGEKVEDAVDIVLDNMTMPEVPDSRNDKNPDQPNQGSEDTVLENFEPAEFKDQETAEDDEAKASDMIEPIFIEDQSDQIFNGGSEGEDIQKESHSEATILDSEDIRVEPIDVEKMSK